MPTPWSRTRTATIVPVPAMVTSIRGGSPSLAWSRALVTKLRTMRSTRTASIAAMRGSGAGATVTTAPRSSIWTLRSPTTRSTTARRSVSSTDSWTCPESMREMARRSSSIRVNRSTWSWRISMERTASGSSISSRASMICSLASRIEDSGVRSSWETSETKRRWSSERFSRRLIWDSRASAMSLKERASAESSSSPVTARRSDRRPEARRCAASEVRRTGMRTRQVRPHTPRMRMRRKPTPAMTMARAAVEIRRCSGSRE